MANDKKGRSLCERWSSAKCRRYITMTGREMGGRAETGGRVSPRAAPTPAYGVVNVTSSVAVPPAVVTLTLPLAGPSVRTVPAAATSLPSTYVTGTV